MDFQVFCIELGRPVTGEDVWAFRYGKQRLNQELSFKCLDEHCQAKFIVRNCAPYLAAWETGFRLYPKSCHRNGCSFVEYQRSCKKKAMDNKGRFTFLPREKNIKKLEAIHGIIN